MYDFRERLDFSKRYNSAPWWEEVYRAAFGANFAGMTTVRDGACGQYAGIDRIVNLSCGRTVAVDEKVRSRDYNDFALERWSDRARRKPGWVQKDLFCDYLAYAFIPSRRCYLLPFLDLQRAWRRFGRQWADQYNPPVLTENSGYTTECVAVPIDEVLRAIQTGALFVWAESPDPGGALVTNEASPPLTPPPASKPDPPVDQLRLNLEV